ncbi:MAG: glycosyltransferase family 39 protein [Chthoniobacter sp.]|uniref:glycosyltransferase family 39 protein n=1 Tax=Chthoniobacter sp. TaxID=2510640 RepID=UPI0032ABDDA9
MMPPSVQNREVTQGRIAFLGFCAILLGIEVATNGYFRALNSDEAQHYAPAIDFVTKSLPHLSLRDYPFPGPPLALWAQALVDNFCRGMLSVRIFSTACAVALGAYFLLRAESIRRLPALGLLAILTFPFFLWNAFTIKQHTFTVACLLVGLDQWCRAEEERSRKSLTMAGAFLTAAALSNQFCAPLCAALCVAGLWRGKRLSRAEIGGIVAVAVPLVCLGLLMLVWGGKQPPAYVDPWPADLSNDWRQHLAQCVLGGISVGAWIGVLRFEFRAHIRVLALALIPSLFLVWLSRLYAPAGNFWTTAQGPISTILSVFSHRAPWLTLFLAAVLMALAVSVWVSPGLNAPWNGRFRILVVGYLGTAAVAVPYLFESYYLLLVMPLLFLVLRYPGTLLPMRLRTVIPLGAMICAGIGYAIFKLKQPS